MKITLDFLKSPNTKIESPRGIVEDDGLLIRDIVKILMATGKVTSDLERKDAVSHGRIIELEHEMDKCDVAERKGWASF